MTENMCEAENIFKRAEALRNYSSETTNDLKKVFKVRNLQLEQWAMVLVFVPLAQDHLCTTLLITVRTLLLKTVLASLAVFSIS